MIRSSLLPGLVAFTSVAALTACQPAAPPDIPVHNAILENQDVRVELIGLKRWTLAMIQDSLARYAPGDSLTSHACAAILRTKLGFADAAVQYYPAGTQGDNSYLAVPVIEPQDSALVRYRDAPRDSLPDRPAWSDAIAVLTNENRVFQRAIQTPEFLLGRLHPDSASSDLRTARPLLELLRGADSTTDSHQLIETLEADGNPRNRAIATVLLARYADTDSAWRALADALRDRTPMVGATASQVLSTLSQSSPQPVDWGPAVESLRAILDGTSLFNQNTLIDALTATRVDSSLAPELLKGGGDLLVAKLRSHDKWAAGSVKRFLTQLSGEDFGSDADAWQRWIRSL